MWNRRIGRDISPLDIDLVNKPTLLFLQSQANGCAINGSPKVNDPEDMLAVFSMIRLGTEKEA